jgi:hypothetical protein
MDRETLNKIWDILVEVCGADEGGRDQFLALQTSDNAAREFRFIGDLGFGGKVWFSGAGNVERVSCYPEDSNLAREAMIEKANEALREM